MHSQQSTSPAPSDDSKAALTGDALQRRRVLFKGLGKGAAVAVVVTPIQTLASINPLPDRLCTVSGVQSNVGSGRTGGTTAKCQGYSPTYFATLANWPNATTSPPGSSFVVGGNTITDQSRFNAVFGSGSNTKLLNVFNANQSASEAIWTAALLSAVKKGLAGLGPTSPSLQGYFPYTPSEVLGLYSQTDATKKAAAEAFFRDYLETQNS